MPDKAFTPHPAYFKAAFSLAFAGRLYIRRWQSTPRKQRQTGEEVEKCHQPQHGTTKCCARGGFHQRWQGVSHHDFNHFKTNSSQNVPRIRAFLRGRWRGNRQKIQKKADSWRRWKSPANQPPRRFQPLNAVQVQGANNHLLRRTGNRGDRQRHNQRN